MAANTKNKTWISGPNGRYLEYGHATLVDGTVSVNTTLSHIENVSTTYNVAAAGLVGTSTGLTLTNLAGTTDYKVKVGSTNQVQFSAFGLDSTAQFFYQFLGY